MQFQEKLQVELLESIGERGMNELTVFNDNFNTFDHVIKTLIRVCNHTPEQAEQCTWLIHHKGKCAVKEGGLEELTPLKDSIRDAGIDAQIL